MTESLSYKNQSIDFQCKSMDWFLYDRDLRHERVNGTLKLLYSEVDLGPLQHLRWKAFLAEGNC